jgi:hypothetical protein
LTLRVPITHLGHDSCVLFKVAVSYAPAMIPSPVKVYQNRTKVCHPSDVYWDLVAYVAHLDNGIQCSVHET